MPDKLEERLRASGPEDYRLKHEELLGWTGSAFLAGEKVEDEELLKGQLYHFLCGVLGYLLSAEVVAEDAVKAADEITRLKGEVEELGDDKASLLAVVDHRARRVSDLEALIDELVEGLEPFNRAATAFGDGPGPIRFYTDTGYREIPLEDFRRAHTLISKARSSGKAGSDA